MSASIVCYFKERERGKKWCALSHPWRSSRDPPRGETVTGRRRTWPLLRPTARPVLAGASAAIVLDGLVRLKVGCRGKKVEGGGESRRKKKFWCSCAKKIGCGFSCLWVTCWRVRAVVVCRLRSTFGPTQLMRWISCSMDLMMGSQSRVCFRLLSTSIRGELDCLCRLLHY